MTKPEWFTKSYEDFLASDQWQTIRQVIIKRDKGLCQLCKAKGKRKKGNQIDHLRYPPRPASFADFVKQPYTDYQLLCEPCHKRKTKADRKSYSKRKKR